MKKVIVSLISALLVALLGVIGLNIFKNASPRERVKADNGSRIIVEELSFYHGNDKIFGKVFKPADEKGFFPDSLGPRPVVIFFHEPLKTAYPEGFVKALVPEGLIGYTTAFHEKDKDVEFMVKKISKERFADSDRIYLVGDSFASEAVVKAAYKLKKAVSGLILIEPELSDKTAGLVPRLGYDVLTIDAAGKASAKTAAIDYLELRGALK
ncbi:MAG: hypothetical protein U0K42_04295 [Bacteroidales bacterium]|nr:hypothetical protein [Bacteroidales bacterium]